MKISSLHIDQLSIGYTEKKKNIALGEPISAQANAGSLIALIGPNGMGKSTLIKTLCRLQPSLSGTLFIEGKDFKHLSRNEFAQKVSLVSTEMIRFSKLKVVDVVGLGRFPYGNWYKQLETKDHQLIQNALQQVGMLAYQHREITGLSDGEFQRVMIARALAQDTPIMILDEPTAFLDLSNKFSIVRLLWNLAHTEHKTIIFSTHDLSVAMQFADIFWVMTESELKTGAPEDLLLDGTLEQLYADSDLFFDKKTTQFKIHQNYKYNIHIQGDEFSVLVTRMALERLGYETDCNKKSHRVVSINVSKQQQFCWQVDRSEDHEFYSINELQEFFKKEKDLETNL